MSVLSPYEKSALPHPQLTQPLSLNLRSLCWLKLFTLSLLLPNLRLLFLVLLAFSPTIAAQIHESDGKDDRPDNEVKHREIAKTQRSHTALPLQYVEKASADEAFCEHEELHNDLDLELHADHDDTEDAE